MKKNFVVTVDTGHEDEFTNKCNELIEQGYYVHSSYCGWSEAYETDIWKAICILRRNRNE